MCKKIFFIMPFGKIAKNGEEIDLDFIYEKIKLKIEKKCPGEYKIFRADSIKWTTMIDAKIYKPLYAADIVIADITNRNPNVMYELGSRHTLKNKITKIISISKKDKDDKYPFDINHLSIHSYEPNDINEQFINNLLYDEKEETDSVIRRELFNLKNGNIHPDINDFLNSCKINDYKALKQKIENFEKEKKYKEGLKYLDKNNKNMDAYLILKKVLFTYKINENDEVQLNKAKEIIESLYPEDTDNPETIGLYCSILNRLLRNNFTVDPSLVERVNTIFLYVHRTIYAYGVYMMSRIFLSLNNKDEFNDNEVKLIAKRLLKQFNSNLLFQHSRDKPWIEDTRKLIESINCDKITEKDFKDESSKNNFKYIKIWKGRKNNGN